MPSQRYRTVARRRPKKFRAHRSWAWERGEGAGLKIHVRGIFEVVTRAELVGCYRKALRVGNRADSGPDSPTSHERNTAPGLGGSPGSCPGSEGAAPEVEQRRDPPERQPHHSVPLIMRCAGEPAVPSESFFLSPPLGEASQPTSVSVPPPLIATCSAHPPPRCACAELNCPPSGRGFGASSKGVGEAELMQLETCFVCVTRDVNLKKPIPPCWVRADVGGIRTYLRVNFCYCTLSRLEFILY